MAEKPEGQVDTIPDPDEDDLDDLDDVLDEFQPQTTTPSKPIAAPSTSASTAPTASGPGRPQDTTSKDAAPTEADLAKDLQAGMSSLISELDANPDMQKQFEQMMQDLIAAGTASGIGQQQEASTSASDAAAPNKTTASAKATNSSGSKKATPADPFSDTIRKTMERMQQSGDAATAATTSGAEPSEEDMLAQMMKELASGAGGMGGMGGEEDFNKMLLSMMTQLTNKEILYEPMKELHDKFPAWMEKNAAGTAKGDLERYRKQQRLVGEIVGRFERRGYSDEDEGDREYIVERMQKMQAAGSPPPDLVGDMSAAQEALGDLDAGCPTQ